DAFFLQPTYDREEGFPSTDFKLHHALSVLRGIGEKDEQGSNEQDRRERNEKSPEENFFHGFIPKFLFLGDSKPRLDIRQSKNLSLMEIGSCQRAVGTMNRFDKLTALTLRPIDRVMVRYSNHEILEGSASHL
ncbi:MAG: hypothetical protein IH857_06850, partial [Deltaproteobacteria bacterium]|nr:hypothetical protein [Deltaproteobacteria bacterium]